MSDTPEGKVKSDIKDWLKARGLASLSRPVANPVGYYHMYVPSGYGDPALDFSGCYRGWAWYIEAKAKDNTPSRRQEKIMEIQAASGAYTAWGDNAEDICMHLGKFFDAVDEMHSMANQLNVRLAK